MGIKCPHPCVVQGTTYRCLGRSSRSSQVWPEEWPPFHDGGAPSSPSLHGGTSPLGCGIFGLSDDSHPGGCEAVSHSGFDMRFPAVEGGGLLVGRGCLSTFLVASFEAQEGLDFDEFPLSSFTFCSSCFAVLSAVWAVGEAGAAAAAVVPQETRGRPWPQPHRHRVFEFSL